MKRIGDDRSLMTRVSTLHPRQLVEVWQRRLKRYALLAKRKQFNDKYIAGSL
jgi:hypothetical protein